MQSNVCMNTISGELNRTQNCQLRSQVQHPSMRQHTKNSNRGQLTQKQGYNPQNTQVQNFIIASVSCSTPSGLVSTPTNMKSHHLSIMPMTSQSASKFQGEEK